MTLASMVFLKDRKPHSGVHQVGIAYALLCLAFCAMLVGCGSKKESPEIVTPPTPQTNESDPKTKADPPGAIEMPSDAAPANEAEDGAKDDRGFELPNDAGSNSKTNALKYASWADVKKSAQSSGKVTVLDIWSTVCIPCVKELPGLAELDKTLGDSVHCVALDIDFDGRKSKPPETYEDDVKKTLAATGVNCTSYICTTSSDDVYADAEIDSIPAVLVYDAKGMLVKKFVDAGDTAGFGYEEDVVPFVKSLLKQ